MIKIRREDCPSRLNKPNSEFVESDYRDTEVKETLLEMQKTKCCYCERSLRKLGETEKWVDHYIPKSSFKDNSGNTQWHLANKWDNLLYSCGTCGAAKADKHPINRATGQREIIDPSSEDIDPEDHIDFFIDYPLITFREKEGSSLGRSTIGKLKLSERNELRRNFRLIKNEVELYFAELTNALEDDDAAGVEQRTNELSRSMSAHLEFAAFKRNFIRKRLKQLNEDDIPKLEAMHSRSFNRITVDFPRGYETRM